MTIGNWRGHSIPCLVKWAGHGLPSLGQHMLHMPFPQDRSALLELQSPHLLGVRLLKTLDGTESSGLQSCCSIESSTPFCSLLPGSALVISSSSDFSFLVSAFAISVHLRFAGCLIPPCGSSSI